MRWQIAAQCSGANPEAERQAAPGEGEVWRRSPGGSGWPCLARAQGKWTGGAARGEWETAETHPTTGWSRLRGTGSAILPSALTRADLSRCLPVPLTTTPGAGRGQLGLRRNTDNQSWAAPFTSALLCPTAKAPVMKHLLERIPKAWFLWFPIQDRQAHVLAYNIQRP